MTHDPQPARRFSAFLAEHRQGALDDELTSSLRDIATAVQMFEKKGSLTLKISVEPNGGNVLIIVDDIDAKVPTPARPAAMYFTDGGGELHRNDPFQRSLLDHEDPSA